MQITNLNLLNLHGTKDEETFAEKVLPLLKRDSYESFSSKIFSKIRNAANPKQLRKVQDEIKLKDIRIK